MADLDANSLLQAIRRLGEVVAPRWQGGVLDLVLMGAASGMVAGWLAGSRVTTDCDVVPPKELGAWEILSQAAKEVADEFGLPQTWLNDAVRVYLWCLPLGWRSRCEPVVRAGPLVVMRLSRGDLIGAKVIAGRTQDLEDLRAMRPSGVELDEVDDHIERLERENLDRKDFDDARAIVRMLRSLA